MPDSLYFAWWNLENLFDTGNPHPGHDQPSPRPSSLRQGYGGQAPGRSGSRSPQRLSPLLPPGAAPIPAFPREGKGKRKEASVNGAGG